MKTTILTLCDFAKDYNGQLSIMGTFNQIQSNEFPSLPISFTIACQFAISSNIVGSHTVDISIIDKETGNPIVQPQNFKLEVAKVKETEPSQNLVTNLILNVDKMIFNHPGTYSIKVVSDGNTQEIEFYAIKVNNN